MQQRMVRIMTEDQNTRAPVVSSQAGEIANREPEHIIDADDIPTPAPGGMELADELECVDVLRNIQLSALAAMKGDADDADTLSPINNYCLARIEAIKITRGSAKVQEPYNADQLYDALKQLVDWIEEDSGEAKQFVLSEAKAAMKGFRLVARTAAQSAVRERTASEEAHRTGRTKAGNDIGGI
jgi:hypothetical protein